MTKIYLFVACSLLAHVVFAQTYGPQRLLEKLNESKSQSSARIDRQLFQSNTAANVRTDEVRWTVDQEKVVRIVKESPAFLSLDIPNGNDGTYQADMIPVKVLADDVAIHLASSPGQNVSYTPGKFYYGLLNGELDSRVSLEINGGRLRTAFVTSAREQWEIRQGGKDASVYEMVKPQIEKMTVGCRNNDETTSRNYTAEQLNGVEGAVANARSDARELSNLVVRLHVQVNYPFLKELGTIPKVMDYVTGMFAQVFTMFAIEGIQMEISEVVIWDKVNAYDPNDDLWPQGNEFKRRVKGGINADIGILLLANFDKGGSAPVAGLCAPEVAYKLATVGVSTSYKLYPQFSNAVQVCTHELGHLLGSQHTQNCYWNGNNTAIDGCYPPIVDHCPRGPMPAPGGGTIMSYCALVPAIGIDLANGFGKQPGNVIRYNVSTAGCLQQKYPSSTTQPTTYCAASGYRSTDPSNAANRAYISSFQFGNQTNTSGDNGGYGNYVNKTLTATIGEDSVLVKIVTNVARPDVLANFWRPLYLWVDMNKDNDFDDTGESIYYPETSAGPVISQKILMPKLREGTYRLRLVYNLTKETAGPCESSGLGEVEDYTLQILPDKPVGNCATPVNVQSNAFLGTYGCVVNFTPVPGAKDYTVRYFRTRDGFRTYQTVTSATLPLIFGIYDGGVDYQFEVRTNCQNGSVSAFSGPYYFRSKDCPPPPLTITGIARGVYSANWTEGAESKVHVFRYRKFSELHNWTQIWNPTPGDLSMLTGLDPNELYIGQLGSQCTIYGDAETIFYGAPTSFPYNYKYEVTFSVRNEWADGATIDVTVSNLTNQAIAGWNVNMDMPNLRVYETWNAQFIGTIPNVFINLGSNANIPAGGSVQFGFNARKDLNTSIQFPEMVLVKSQPARLKVQRQNYPIVVRARGTAPGAAIHVTVGGTTVANYTLSTTLQDYTVTTSQLGGINVYYDNDAANRDVILDYIQVSGKTLQAEEQTVNTAAWNNGCGNGSLTEWMQCNGYIGFLGYSNPARETLVTGVTETVVNELVKLSPNPVENKLLITLPSDDVTEISFFSNDKLVRQEVITTTTHIDTSNLAAGFYIVKVKSGKQQTVHRLIKY